MCRDYFGPSIGRTWHRGVADTERRAPVPRDAERAHTDAGLRRYVVHELPFTVNAVGAASLVDHVPWKPSEVEPPAAMAPL